MSFFGIVLFCALLLTIVRANPDGKRLTEPVHLTKCTTITGNIKDGYEEFLGIPFAQPPVGDLRFRVSKQIEYSGAHFLTRKSLFWKVQTPLKEFFCDPPPLSALGPTTLSPVDWQSHGHPEHHVLLAAISSDELPTQRL